MAKDSQEEPGKDMLGEKQWARQALGRAGDTSEVGRIGKWLEYVVEVTLCPRFSTQTRRKTGSSLYKDTPYSGEFSEVGI